MKFISVFLLFAVSSIMSFGQSVSLVTQLKKNKITVINRTIAEYENEGIELNAQEESGLAILNDIDFKTGTINLEIKGENAPGKSFVGLAFNIQNDSTYEAVYFRPFNFLAEETARRSHMVQYIFEPAFPWFKLREERKGGFEAELTTPPNPDDWFEVQIAIKDNEVSVFVNGQNKAVMKVERLATLSSDKIGLWVGNGSSGRFRNLSISRSE